MDFLSSPNPRPRTLSFSKLRRIPSFRSKSRKEEPTKQKSPSLCRSKTDTEIKKTSKFSQLKTRLSGLYSRSVPSSPGTTSPGVPVPKIPQGILSSRSSDSSTTSATSSRRVTFPETLPAQNLNRCESKKPSPQLVSSNWPLSVQDVPRKRPQISLNVNPTIANARIAPIQYLNDASPISRFSLDVNTPSPPRSGASSPADSFHTARGEFSPVGTPFIPSDASVTASDAYPASNSAKFWDDFHQRNERQRLRQERMKEQRRKLSVCERIRMERFQKRSESSSGSSSRGNGIPEEHQQFIFPGTANYEDDDSEEEEEEEDTGYIGFGWARKFEERYCGSDEKDYGRNDCEDNGKSELTYWEQIDELRRAVGNAVADVALRPTDWRKLVD